MPDEKPKDPRTHGTAEDVALGGGPVAETPVRGGFLGLELNLYQRPNRAQNPAAPMGSQPGDRMQGHLGEIVPGQKKSPR